MMANRLYWISWLHRVHLSDNGRVALCGMKLPQYFGQFAGMSGEDTPYERARHEGRFCSKCEAKDAR